MQPETELRRMDERYEKIDASIMSGNGQSDPNEGEHKAASPTPAAGVEWGDLVPLEVGSQVIHEFPVDALPQRIRDAVVEYAGYGKQPIPLIASSALATASLCCQGHYDVARDSRLVSPISLSILLIAGSGERKTAADSVFSAPARQWLSGKIKKYRENWPYEQAAHAAWGEKLAAIKNALKQAYKPNSTNNGSQKGGSKYTSRDIESLEEDLKNCQVDEPLITPEPDLFYSDTTQEGLVKSMQHGLPIGALWEDEAGLVIGSVGMSKDKLLSFLATINKLWEARPLKANRSSVENRSASGKRFTVNLMMQPGVLRELMEAKNGMSRDTGFLARILICEPISTMGTRWYREPGAMPSVEQFRSRVEDLLNKPLRFAKERPDELEPLLLQLSPDAKVEWVEYHNEVEAQINNVGELANVSDFASKSAEQAVRLAALFHAFSEGEGSVINAETMQQGIQIAAWYLAEALRLIGVYETPQDLADARAMIDWMISQDEGSFTTTEIARSGPRATRVKCRRDLALVAAIYHGQLAQERDGKKSTYFLNPSLKETHQ